MPNAVLDRLLTSRQEQISFIDQTLDRVETEGRDMVDAEVKNLDAARQRIVELNAQISPLEDFEKLRDAHDHALPVPRGDRVPAQARAAGGNDRAPTYRSAGEFVVDLIRARGIHTDPDPAAQQRIAQTRALVNQITTDTPGLLPTPIVGPVVNLIDSNRPLISSLGGAKALGGIPGSTFTRPKVTQHTTVGPQSAEKTLLPSQKMVIGSVPFAKQTYGGTVDISRQDIDWTSPSAWDILVRDLAAVYAIQTETAVALDFKTKAIGTAVVVGTNDLHGWTTALYTAAMHSYQASFQMPDRIWCSLDVWAALGSLVDVARVVLPPTSDYDNAAGMSSLSSFSGDVLGLPRIVVPTFPAGTAIVGPSAAYEAYEEVIGLLSVIEPSILGVTVAYGGYVAFGALYGNALVPLTPPAGMPTMDAVPAIDAEVAADEDGNPTTGRKSSAKS
jgi:HK97 family phage major capsid protein